MNDSLPASLESRVLAGRAMNEDAVVVSIPAGRALVQTVDILAPNVNDAFSFGRIAAANALSDVYAMGGLPWSAMSIACFPERMAKEEPEELVRILEGALEAMTEAGCVSAGGHTVNDENVKFGLAVTGVIDPSHIARNNGLRPGLRLFLTKPVGSGLLANAVKARWEGWEESERLLRFWCGRLNRTGGAAVARFRLPAATDVTGFGLGGHVMEMAQASGVSVRIFGSEVPLMGDAYTYAGDGLVPGASIRNRKFCACRTVWERDKDEDLENCLFDTQTSGGLVLGVPAGQADEVRAFLQEGGDLAAEIGEVLPKGDAVLRIA